MRGTYRTAKTREEANFYFGSVSISYTVGKYNGEIQ
jgi:hypothetical protein